MSAMIRVLFPTDFSSGCQALVPTVRKMIETWSAEVTLLHVVESRRRLERKPQPDRLVAQLQTIASRDLHAPYLQCRVEFGDAGDRILEHVSAHSVDLVVLPSGGSGSLEDTALGSVADRVLAEAPCAVWLDWGSARCRDAAGMSAQKVCCALELDESDEPVLRQAAELSLELGAQLQVVHALFPAPGKPVTMLWNEHVRERALQQARRHLDSLCRRHFPSAETTVEIGSRHTVLSRALQNQEAGLLVTGNRRASILAAEAECPVLRLALPAAAESSVRPLLQYAAAGA